VIHDWQCGAELPRLIRELVGGMIWDDSTLFFLALQKEPKKTGWIKTD